MTTNEVTRVTQVQGAEDKTMRERVVRPLYALFGVILLGAGAALMLVGGVGVDPFTAMNRGIADQLGLGLGPVQLVMNLLLLAVVFFTGRYMIGLGTIINMVLVGYLITWFTALFSAVLPSAESLLGQAVYLVIALLIFDFGVSAYICAGSGTAPYDAIAPIVVERTGWAYRYVRWVQDILVVIIAAILSGPVGLATVITAFFNGPLIEFFNKKVNQALVEKLVNRTL
ncbi:YczE/YyaS/YitT family protein [Kocuria sp.]|uniref:YczE/YyaS/YitT family protein n=1 Tax=Kocuria sp. TaxID=1871328 RepID=UPI0026E106F5|nr:hypothetical protein [Kocuria sp.]MDO5617552.1 hypothetical protein [Kocuria sp.]